MGGAKAEPKIKWQACNRKAVAKVCNIISVICLRQKSVACLHVCFVDAIMYPQHFPVSLVVLEERLGNYVCVRLTEAVKRGGRPRARRNRPSGV